MLETSPTFRPPAVGHRPRRASRSRCGSRSSRRICSRCWACRHSRTRLRADGTAAPACRRPPAARRLAPAPRTPPPPPPPFAAILSHEFWLRHFGGDRQSSADRCNSAARRRVVGVPRPARSCSFRRARTSSARPICGWRGARTSRRDAEHRGRAGHRADEAGRDARAAPEADGRARHRAARGASGEEERRRPHHRRVDARHAGLRRQTRRSSR